MSDRDKVTSLEDMWTELTEVRSDFLGGRNVDSAFPASSELKTAILYPSLTLSTSSHPSTSSKPRRLDSVGLECPTPERTIRTCQPQLEFNDNPPTFSVRRPSDRHYVED